VTAGASVLHGEQRTPTAERADRRITAACVDPALGPDAPKLCMFALTSQAERQGLQVLQKYFAVQDGQRWAICVSQGEPFATPSEVVERLASFDRLWALDEAFDLAASVAARNRANWPVGEPHPSDEPGLLAEALRRHDETTPRMYPQPPRDWLVRKDDGSWLELAESAEIGIALAWRHAGYEVSASASPPIGYTLRTQDGWVIRPGETEASAAANLLRIAGPLSLGFERLTDFVQSLGVDPTVDCATEWVISEITRLRKEVAVAKLANVHSRERYERDLLVQGAIERIGRAKGLPMETASDWTVTVSELAAEMGLDELRAAFPDRVVEERDGVLWMGESTHFTWNVRVRREEPVSAAAVPVPESTQSQLQSIEERLAARREAGARLAELDEDPCRCFDRKREWNEPCPQHSAAVREEPSR
jgi:hypothetical protein